MDNYDEITNPTVKSNIYTFKSLIQMLEKSRAKDYEIAKLDQVDTYYPRLNPKFH